MTQPTDEIPNMLQLLQAGDAVQRQQAAIALSRLKDPRMVTPLLTALNDPDSTVRANAATGLGHNEAAEAVDPLIALLRDDPEDIVRERAATALAQIGDPRAVDPLIDALDEGGTWVRNRIAYVLGASKDPRAVEPLLELLNHEEASTQGVAAWALGAIGDERAFDPLLGLLGDETASVRGNAAWALGELADERAIDPLLAQLADGSPEVRAKCAWALGNLGELTGETRMVKPLIGLLTDFAEAPTQAAHIFVSQYAAEALTQIGTDEAHAAVEDWRPIAREKLLPYRVQDGLRGLRHRDLQTRKQAIQYLLELDKAAVPALLDALRDDNTRLRQGAAQTLGLLGDESALHPLLMALADPDPGVWSQATAALSKLAQSPEALAALELALRSQERRVQQGAAIALWRSQRTEDAFPILLQSVQDDELVVRGSAITSLWQQPDERAVATLQIQLQQEEGMMARYVLQALQTIGTPAAQATIQHWLANNDR